MDWCNPFRHLSSALRHLLGYWKQAVQGKRRRLNCYEHTFTVLDILLGLDDADNQFDHDLFNPEDLQVYEVSIDQIIRI